MTALYMIETGATVRQAAAKFGISKSTVHKDVTERLERCSPALFYRVREILSENKAQRHLRGGEATRRKYLARHETEKARENDPAKEKTLSAPGVKAG